MIVLLLIVNLAGLFALMSYVGACVTSCEEEISHLKRRVERLEEKRR